MRALVQMLAIGWLLCAVPASAMVTLPPTPVSPEQIEAERKAEALVEAMPRDVLRHRAASYIAYRLMMRGDCSQAMLVMKRELGDIVDATALGGLATGALVGRDARCMEWVATRIEAALPSMAMSEEQRVELRLRGYTMFALAGQMTRASRMPPADYGMLETVPESLKQREVALEGLTLVIEMSDAPTRLETLIVDRLWDYRRTPLQLSFARSLAKRAEVEPRFLSRPGWVEVALALLVGGDREAAEQLLVTSDIRHMTIAGLEVEIALRRNDLNGAAAIFAANEWGTKGKSVHRAFGIRPDVFIPYIDGPSVFGSDRDTALRLVSFSEALDQVGYPKAAERAAGAAVTSFEREPYASNRKAQALARLGDFQAARQLLREALKDPDKIDPGHFRQGIVTGAALAGDLAEAERAIDEAPAGQRDWLLVHALVAMSPIRSPTRDGLENRLERRLGENGRLTASADTMVAFAEGGVRTSLLTALLGRLKPERKSAALAILVARVALRHGHRETALALGDVAQSLLPEGPQADAELVNLSELYWALGMPDEATSYAMRVAHPVGKVDALTRALLPTHGEPRTKLSYVTF